ncbi:unnamed protein product [Cuscuta europaea]|uniref:ACB domain-containing protein n=1 Tax=Cuscuta europaea TaxID=41803 RepID=A0A9P0YMG5_CUSEU|nr:unnamed protein product [Cuscuta europaea]
MQLYGLHKVATEGPCCTPQPMAFKLSARAKWNAWQKLGDISQDEAMEQYIALLSRSITDWKHGIGHNNRMLLRILPPYQILEQDEQ